MTDDHEYQRKADELLSRAAATENMQERSRLIQEALYWHNLATGEDDLAIDLEPDPPANDDGDDAGEARA